MGYSNFSWRKLKPKNFSEISRKKLEYHIKKYLASGGVITILPPDPLEHAPVYGALSDILDEGVYCPRSPATADF